MEIKSLILGLGFSLGIFAFKSGIGLYYLISKQESRKVKSKYLIISALGYLAIFLFSGWLVNKIKPTELFEKTSLFLKSGMLIHFIMAALLFFWGIYLLTRKKGESCHSHAWIPLAVPCPVCITVIFFSSLFLISYFPNRAYQAVLMAYGIFMGINLISQFSLKLRLKMTDESPETLLGSSMLFIAVYFMLSVIIMPLFSELEQIYNIALYQSEKQEILTKNHLFLYGIISLLFFAGFTINSMKIKKVKS